METTQISIFPTYAGAASWGAGYMNEKKGWRATSANYQGHCVALGFPPRLRWELRS